MQQARGLQLLQIMLCLQHALPQSNHAEQQVPNEPTHTIAIGNVAHAAVQPAS